MIADWDEFCELVGLFWYGEVLYICGRIFSEVFESLALYYAKDKVS